MHVTKSKTFHRWHDDLLQLRNGGSGTTSENSTASVNQFQSIFIKKQRWNFCDLGSNKLQCGDTIEQLYIMKEHKQIAASVNKRDSIGRHLYSRDRAVSSTVDGALKSFLDYTPETIIIQSRSYFECTRRMTIPGPDGIELDVWNDGIFMLDPLRYDSGVMLNMLVARLKFKEFERMIIKETNCANLVAMYSRIPDSDLEKGLVKVVNGYDLIHMYDMSKMYGGIKLYLDHCDIDLSKYLADPDPSTAEKEAEEEALLGKGKEKTNDVDKGKEKIEVESDSENDGIIEDIDSDDNDYSNKSFDYLSASEEELIQLRTRTANRSKTRPPPIPDMATFTSTSRAIASNKNKVLVEHDDFIAVLLRKLKGDGKDSNLQDLFLGEKFVDVLELKDCLPTVPFSNGYSIWFERSLVDVLIAVCGQIPPTLKEPSLGKQMKQFRKNPEIKLCDIADLVMKKYKCTITPNRCRSAKIWALTEYEKTRKEHYRLLRSYGKELLDTNRGLTVKLKVTNTDDKTCFDRFYVCFGGLKEGF
nr:multidrug resistance-associated protein 5 [Tanacetum cinerariifolium]